MAQKNIFLLIILLFSCFQLALGQQYATNQSLVWEYAKHQTGEPLPIKTRALFYWSRKITNSNQLTPTMPVDTINIGSVPLLWLALPIKNQKVSATGMATFHLQIELPDTLNTYAIYMKGILAAYEVWSDGKCLGAAGKVGLDEASTKHDFKTKILPLPQKKKVDLFINIANYYHWRGGGFLEPLLFGEVEATRQAFTQNLLIDTILIGILVAIGIYHLILFVFYPKNRVYLYFGLWILACSARVLCIRDVLLKELWNDVSYQLIQQLRYVGFYLGVSFISMYVKHMFEQLYYPVWHKVIFFVGVIVTFLTFVLPIAWIPYISPIYQFFFLLASAYLFYIIFKNLKTNRIEVILLLVGALFALATLINDILVAQEVINGSFIFLYGFLGLALAHTLILANRNKIVYLNSKKLTDELAYLNLNLESQVVQRTLEIQQQQETIIAQKNRLEEQAGILQNNNKKLKALDEAKSRFFANISHEFRTPLTLMIAGLEEIKKWSKGQNQPMVVEVMTRNIRWLQQQVNQLLDVTKIEAGKMGLNKQAEEVVSVFRSHALMFESLFDKKGIDFSFHSLMVPTTALLDISAVGKIILNLISNAYKFTATGGKVEVLLRTDGQNLIFQVKDTGIGIPPEQLTHIFERFHQIDHSHKQQGTGIGLALTKELVDLYDGQIWVESTLGEGSYFTVSIPLTLSEKQISDTDHNIARAAQVYKESIKDSFANNTDITPNHIETKTSKPLVLIVEDNADLRLMLKHILKPHYQTAFANDGEEGIQTALEIVPDLIVSDVMMPNKNGFELCETLKQHQVTSHIPIVLLTARVEHEDKLEGLSMGADDYLPKPFEQEELLLRLQNLIRIRMKIKEYLSSQSTLLPTFPEELVNNPLDKGFIEKINHTLSANYTNPQFGIADLADAVAMPHSRLARKMKALLDCTPNKFIQHFRLQQAAELLKNKEYKVGDVGFAVGFSSRSYFNKYFKEAFGQTPKSYQDGLD